MGRRRHRQEDAQAGGSVGQEGVQAGGCAGRRMCRQEDPWAGGCSGRSVGRRMCRQEDVQAGGCTGVGRRGLGRQERASMGTAAPYTHLLLGAGDGGEVGLGEAAGGLRIPPGLLLP